MPGLLSSARTGLVQRIVLIKLSANQRAVTQSGRRFTDLGTRNSFFCTPAAACPAICQILFNSNLEIFSANTPAFYIRQQRERPRCEAGSHS